ncbi:hypothetical protein FKF78_11815 [Aeromonas hydrophila]|nr:hypothetical protein [Aeromonas hydrophila]
MTDDFSDNDEQVTIDEDVARRLATSLMGFGRWPVTVQSFSIAGQTGPFVLVRYTPLPVWAASAWRRTGRTASPGDNYNGACRWSPMC